MSPITDNLDIAKQKNTTLLDLLDGLEWDCSSGIKPGEVSITSVSADSRDSQRGTLFIALPGLHHDGHDFIHSVIKNGCQALVVEKGRSLALLDEYVCVVETTDTRTVYSQVAAAFYDHPSRQMNFIGITGTNGKTTVSYLLESLLEQQGTSVGVIGTVNYRYRDKKGEKKVFPAPFTTPEPLILQKLLREMANHGVRYVVMEVSSHALAQQRIGDVQFDVAAFTNLSHDHLDYHNSMEEYFLAKTKIFSQYLKADGSAVIVFDGKEKAENNWPKKMFEICKAENILYLKTVGSDDGDIRLLEMKNHLHGSDCNLLTPKGSLTLQISLVGSFNVYNAMTAMAIAMELGFGVGDAAKSLCMAKGAPGRLEHITLGGSQVASPHVFVDYAHTPDALRQVLETLKKIPHGELFCVFGCGGDRDTSKRWSMGNIAAKAADVVIVADDNPRSESPEEILYEISCGVKDAGKDEKKLDWKETRKVGERGYIVHGNRSEAIAAAIGMAKEDDIVLIAGKGHEKYQITREGRRFFDDCLEVKKCLTSWTSGVLENIFAQELGSVWRDNVLGGVSIDSRTLEKGDIFVAIKGENFDGHNFLNRVDEAGAAVAIVNKKRSEEEVFSMPLVEVDDTLYALGELARCRRSILKKFGESIVVGITGSCGKTTVKEMTSLIFEEWWPDGAEVPKGRVLKTQGNFNNLVGLPLSLLPLSAKHRGVILEMGMNQPGEIARLAEIADPDISCILNVHAAHLEGLQSIDGVLKAKAELFSESRNDTVLIVNLDDERVRLCAEKYSQKKISYGVKSKGLGYTPKVWASDIQFSQAGGLKFVLHIGQEENSALLKVPGEHNISNALAAASIAHAAGIPIETIVEGLAKFQGADKRMMVQQTTLGYWLINDTYNANPASMLAGLKTLSQMTSGIRVALLGDMLELGESSTSAHQELGVYAAQSGVDFLAVVGEFAGFIASGALSAGMAENCICVCKDKDEVFSWVQQLHENGKIHAGSWFLVKASRGMRFETIVQRLLEDL